MNERKRRSARNIVPGILTSGAVITVVFALGAPVLAQQGDASKLKNPVASNPDTLATGRKLFKSNCASCHGESGKGDGTSGAVLKPKPSDLTDPAWKHGESDGEIFALIRDGVKQTSMRGYAGRMTSQELWSLVNFLRTLGPTTNKSQ